MNFKEKCKLGEIYKTLLKRDYRRLNVDLKYAYEELCEFKSPLVKPLRDRIKHILYHITDFEYVSETLTLLSILKSTLLNKEEFIKEGKKLYDEKYHEFVEDFVDYMYEKLFDNPGFLYEMLENFILIKKETYDKYEKDLEGVLRYVSKDYVLLSEAVKKVIPDEEAFLDKK